jgi:transposase
MVRERLRDDQVERIAALLPGKVTDPGRTAANNRLLVEAVLWIARTGSPWRDLPPQFGP